MRNKMRLNVETTIRTELDVSNNATPQEIKLEYERTHNLPISILTLLINGKIIADNDDLFSAALTDGSLINIHINYPPSPPKSRLPDWADPDAMEARRAFSLSSTTSTSSRGNTIFLSLEFEGTQRRLPAAVDPSRNATQLRSELQEITGVKPLASFTFFHESKRVNENRSFNAQKIRNGDTITIHRSSITKIGGSESSEEGMIRVKVEHGGEAITVEVMAAQKAGVLRVKLGKQSDIKLPKKYFLIYRNSALLEEISFREQDVGDGDVIQISS